LQSPAPSLLLFRKEIKGNDDDVGVRENRIVAVSRRFIHRNGTVGKCGKTVPDPRKLSFFCFITMK
jgi:hypothetical protein